MSLAGNDTASTDDARTFAADADLARVTGKLAMARDKASAQIRDSFDSEPWSDAEFEKLVEGTVTATIKGGKMIDITETGSFSGVVEIDQADIAGRFDGDLTVKGKLIIRASAHVTGNIHYAQLQIDTGARVNGQLQIKMAYLWIT